MTNEIGPAPSEHWLSALNLPEFVLGPAGKAISRLIGEIVEIPAAGLQNVAQGIRNKTDAQKVISQALAEAAAKQVTSDPELVRRAVGSCLAKEFRAQSNKESIAAKTIELLQGEQTVKTEGANSDQINDDWLNVFEKYAESASSERLQEIWARVL